MTHDPPPSNEDVITAADSAIWAKARSEAETENLTRDKAAAEESDAQAYVTMVQGARAHLEAVRDGAEPDESTLKAAVLVAEYNLNTAASIVITEILRTVAHAALNSEPVVERIFSLQFTELPWWPSEPNDIYGLGEVVVALLSPDFVESGLEVIYGYEIHASRFHNGSDVLVVEFLLGYLLPDPAD